MSSTVKAWCASFGLGFVFAVISHLTKLDYSTLIAGAALFIALEHKFERN